MKRVLGVNPRRRAALVVFPAVLLVFGVSACSGSQMDEDKSIPQSIGSSTSQPDGF